MPTIRLTSQYLGAALPVSLPAGGRLDILPVQFRCLVRLPNFTLPQDVVIDTGAPLIYFPRILWTRLREGSDFEWLQFAPGANSPQTQIASWHFTFQMARFLSPLSLMDYSTEVGRPDVIAAFASGDPPARPTRKAPPPIIVGLWGGLLEGGTIGIERDPARGHVAGTLAFA